MANFTVALNTGNAAFDDQPGPEVARILRTLADTIDAEGLGNDVLRLRDSNGNRVGFATLVDDD